jgi:hypothetical protein
MNWMMSSYEIQKAQTIFEDATHLEIPFWMLDAEVNNTTIIYFLMEFSSTSTHCCGTF